MCSNVLPSFSSKVSVVTAPCSPSSLVQTMRASGTTSRYLPKKAMGFSKSGWLNSRRYLPPVRTSFSQETMVMGMDFGTHQRLNSSSSLQASNTRRAGASKVRVMTSSRSDLRSTLVRFFMAVDSLSLSAAIGLLLPFQFFHHPIERVEARLPEPAVVLDPGRLFFQAAGP